MIAITLVVDQGARLRLVQLQTSCAWESRMMQIVYCQTAQLHLLQLKADGQQIASCDLKVRLDLEMAALLHEIHWHSYFFDSEFERCVVLLPPCHHAVLFRIVPLKARLSVYLAKVCSTSGAGKFRGACGYCKAFWHLRERPDVRLQAWMDAQHFVQALSLDCHQVGLSRVLMGQLAFSAESLKIDCQT